MNQIYFHRFFFFSENSSKELNILFSRKFAVNMVTTNTFYFFVAAVKIGPCITHCTRFIYSTGSQKYAIKRRILRVNYNFRLVYFIGFSSGYLYLWYKIILKSSSSGNSIN